MSAGAMGTALLLRWQLAHVALALTFRGLAWGHSRAAAWSRWGGRSGRASVTLQP